ncbi:hypothetical protein RB600_002079 [Gaeumannomyces tritici]
MPEDERQHLAGRNIDICEELALTWASSAMTGVDGRRLFENWLNFCVGLPRTCEPDEDNIQNICERLGTDRSKPFVFAHSGIGGGEVVIDSGGSIGLINWANAGYHPRECLGLERPDVNGGYPPASEWRDLVAEMMGERGHPDVVPEYKRRVNEYMKRDILEER